MPAERAIPYVEGQKKVSAAVLWEATPCILVEYYRCFGGKESCGNYTRNVAEIPLHNMMSYFKGTVIVTTHCCKYLKLYTRKRRLTSIHRPMSHGGNDRSFLIRTQFPKRIREADVYR
jgi:hypothetical protein